MDDIALQSVGLLVAEQPMRAALFDRLQIDFCCGGRQTLQEACLEKNLSIQDVLCAIRNSDEQARDSDAAELKNDSNLLHATLVELVDHIQNTHHAYLARELPRLMELVEKVARVHGARDPRLQELAPFFKEFKEELESHLRKEETVLFPFIRQLDSDKPDVQPFFGTLQNPVICLESEHEETGKALLKLRELTDEYKVPAQACASWSALYQGLAHLDRDLRSHIHKENSILFPRALQRRIS